MLQHLYRLPSLVRHDKKQPRATQSKSLPLRYTNEDVNSKIYSVALHYPLDPEEAPSGPALLHRWARWSDTMHIDESAQHS